MSRDKLAIVSPRWLYAKGFAGGSSWGEPPNDDQATG